jgi:hypothetical protein
MLRLVFVICISVLSLNLFAQSDWEVTKTSQQWIDLNPLKFTNRASCALDSKKPTNTAFLMVDNLNVGRAIYRLSKQLGKDSSFTKEGAYRFRYTVIGLTHIIARAMFNGSLPLLPIGEEKGQTSQFQKLASQCDPKEGHCGLLDEYISQIWESSEDINQLLKLDSFNSNNFLGKQRTAKLSCYYLKQFSPIEAHLYGSKPKNDALESIAKAVESSHEYLSSCTDFEQQTDLKQAVFQFDFRKLDSEEWNQKGFHFWNSLKIYLSWAFRYSKEVDQLAFPYGPIFKQVDIEESIYFFSNGCSSIEKPECSRETLSLNSLRFLAQASGTSELGKLEMLDYIPNGPTSDILTDNRPMVNSDVLDFADFPSADAWASNFRENMNKVRGFIKLKLTRSMTQLSLISSNLSVEKILNDTDKKHELFLAKKMQTEEENLYRQDLYYLCSEYRAAMDEKFSFLRTDLIRIKEQNNLSKLSGLITGKEIDQLLTHLDLLSPKIMKYCEGLEKLNIWTDPFVLNPEGYAPWFKEHAKDQLGVKANNLLGDLVKFHNPILSLQKTDAKTNNHIICLNGVHCSRKVLSLVVDIYGSLQYVEGLLSLSGIKSPDLVNPYSERVACGAYDPWFKTRNTVFEFFKDMAAAAVWTFVPTPVYIDGTIKPKQVVSFDQLIKDGKVYFDPRFAKKRVDGTVFMDFGPLTGAPCMVSISSQTNMNPPGFLYLNGITAQSCRQTDRNRVNVFSPDDIQRDRLGVSACVSCTISLTSVAGSTSAFVPYLRPVYFVLKGIVRLVNNLRDPQDIPRSWSADLNSVYRSYRKYGEIRKACVRPLRNGKNCLKSNCEEQIVESFENQFKKYVSDVAIDRGDASELYVEGCDEPITVKTPFLGCSQSDYPKEAFNIPTKCAALFRTNI